MRDYHSFDPAAGHGLPHDPLKAIIAPRPIGWISTLGADGIANLAPYSYFNIFAQKPPILIFGSDGSKDSLRNAVASGEFVFNLVTRTHLAAMNASSATVPPGVDEFALAGLEKLGSDLVRAPRVAGAAAAMECRLIETRQLHDLDGAPVDSHLVIGQVVRVHIARDCLIDGKFDITRAGTMARCGYRGDYIEAGDTFELLRPRGA